MGRRRSEGRDPQRAPSPRPHLAPHLGRRLGRRRLLQHPQPPQHVVQADLKLVGVNDRVRAILQSHEHRGRLSLLCMTWA